MLPLERAVQTITADCRLVLEGRDARPDLEVRADVDGPLRTTVERNRRYRLRSRSMPNLERLTASPDPIASQVADIIRATFDPDSKQRDTLPQLLPSLLFRGGTVSPLTPDVTAVLLEGLTEPRIPRRADVLESLYAIAVA